MPLPKIAPVFEVVALPDGTKVEVRGLTRAEVLAINDVANGTPAEFEIHTLACGTDVPASEAREWYGNAPSGYTGALVEAITRLSGLSEDQGKGSGGD